jgi:hypothetical protein
VPKECIVIGRIRKHDEWRIKSYDESKNSWLKQSATSSRGYIGTYRSPFQLVPLVPKPHTAHDMREGASVKYVFGLDFPDKTYSGLGLQEGQGATICVEVARNRDGKPESTRLPMGPTAITARLQRRALEKSMGMRIEFKGADGKL